VAGIPGSRDVGRIVGLWRYPVKSMAAEELEAVEVSWHGLEGDRRWAFVRPEMERSGFPWLTIREQPDLWQYRPSFVDPSRPDASRTTVATPAGAELDVADEALAAELGEGVRVIKQNRGVFDTAPLSLISTRSIASIDALVAPALHALRFRPNLLVEPIGGVDFPEDTWVSRVLTIGGLAMRVDERDQRCVMINVDPVSRTRDASVLKTVATQREACLGVYGSIVTPGRVSLGDRVRVVD
jgi:hypothetical protein